IGLLITLITQAVLAVVSNRWKGTIAYMIALPVAALGGIGVTLLYVNTHSVEAIQRIVQTVFATTLIFGGAVAALFYLYTRKTELEQKLHSAELPKSAGPGARLK